MFFVAVNGCGKCDFMKWPAARQSKLDNLSQPFRCCRVFKSGGAEFFTALREVNFTGKLVISRTLVLRRRQIKLNSSLKNSRRVNVAVVGLGFMGVTHLRAYLKNPQARASSRCAMRRGCRKTACCAASPATSKNPATIRLGAAVKVYRQLGELAGRPRRGTGGHLHADGAASGAGHRRAAGGQKCALRKTARAKLPPTRGKF